MATKLTETIDELIAEGAAQEASKPRGPFKANIVNPNSSGNEDLRAEYTSAEVVTRTPGLKKHGITDRRLVSIAGKDYEFQRRDQYGFWYIQPMKGRLPEALAGVYTSPMEAEQALTRYINSQK